MSSREDIPIQRDIRFGIGRDADGGFFGSFGPRANTVKSLPEQLAEKLAEQIVRGDYGAGVRLHEAALAEKFAVSRGPVREALRLLEREGLVTMMSWRGASVTRLTRKALSDIFSTRAALMGLCAAELAERRSEKVLATFAEGTAALNAASDAGDVGEFLAIVYQLSMFIGEATGNQVAYGFLLSLGRRTLPLTRTAFNDLKQRQSWAKNWGLIVKAIRAGDPEAARLASYQLIATIKAAALVVLDRLEQDERLAAASPAKSPSVKQPPSTPRRATTSRKKAPSPPARKRNQAGIHN